MAKIKEALRGGLPCNTIGYLNSYQDNIFQGYMPERFRNMFINGSGSELHSKAEAVHSSSMLAYNFFHWVTSKSPITIKGVEYTDVFFEVKMKAITLDANMDILLIDKTRTRLLFIESKFLEYLEVKKYNLGVTYRKQNGWDSFLNKVDEIVPEKNEKRDYQEGIKQGVTHLFALEKLKNEKAFKHFNIINGLNLDIKSIQDVNEIRFMNLLFEPDEKFPNEHTKFENYKKLYDGFRGIAQNSDIIDVPIEILTYSELWQEAEEDIKKVNKGHLHQYLLDRYMRFAEMK